MTEPRTQAGRDLLARIQNLNGRSFPLARAEDILAIEAEALPSVERLARALHAARYGPLLPGQMHWETVICDCLEVAPAILAELRDEPEDER